MCPTGALRRSFGFACRASSLSEEEEEKLGSAACPSSRSMARW